MTIMQKVVYHLADVERERATGLPRSELVQWYLEDMEDSFATVEEAEREAVLIEKVITKLVKEKYLLELRGEGLSTTATTGTDDEPAAVAEEPMLSVHPECDLAA